MLCAVVEDRDVAIRQTTRIVLIAEERWCEFRMIADKRELIALAAKLPHHVACCAIDLDHLRHVAHGNDPVAIVIDPERVVVTEPNGGSCEIFIRIGDR